MSRSGAARFGVAARTAARGIAAMGMTSAILSCDATWREPAPEQRSEAERLYAVGLEHQAKMEYREATAVMLRALESDPSFASPLFALFGTESPMAAVRTLDALDVRRAHIPDVGLASCVDRVAAFRRGTALQVVAGQTLSDLAAQCHQRANAYLQVTTASSTVLQPERVTDALLGDPELVRLRFSALAVRARWRDLSREAERLTREPAHPLVRAAAWAQWAVAEHELDHDSVARRIEQDVRRDPGWRLPGFRARWGADISGHPFLTALARRAEPSALAAHADTMRGAIESVRLSAAAEGDVSARYGEWMLVSTARLDRGQLTEAIRGLTYAVALADSLRDPGARAFARMRLGRALVKAGQSNAAATALVRARSIADSIAYPAVTKEVEHNLLHLYESMGRFADARDAGERFVRAAALGGLHAVRMISHRDMGMFLRARGAIAESRPYFAAMLADIDSLKHDWYYAAEYHELTGNPEQALAAYQRAYANSDNPVAALEGIVRIALAMGDTPSAARWAAVHDARRDAAGHPESRPLLPDVRARSADLTSAREAFSVARTRAASHAQQSAWAALTADLAALELRRGDPARARLLADSAVGAARGVADNASVLRAQAISALAGLRAGSSTDALGQVRAAADAADQSQSPQLRSELRAMEAEVLALTGRWRDAIDRYSIAAALLDSMAVLIPLTPRQAVFRSAQRNVYDLALAEIVRHASETSAVAQYARWSVRRKGRAYAGARTWMDAATGAGIGGALSPPPPSSAVIDYVLLDSTVAALVLTPRLSRVVALPVSAPRVREMVARFRAALTVRVGSALDLSRAEYPVEVAHELYQGLVRPLEPFLNGATSITVIPDGVLALIPFDALVTRPPPVDAGADKAEFLIDRVSVSSAPTLLRPRASWRTKSGSVVVVAPPGAPGAALEIEAIRAGARSSSLTVLAGNAATKSAVLRAIPSAAVVHFVAHAEANEQVPGSSLIELAPDGSGDGLLRAADLATLSLDSPLVILSACETAGGRVLEGEGVLSLSRSFIQAGARATVATLWPVGPFASDFSRVLYASLRRGADLRHAVNEGKLVMRRAGATPFAWAPFQLVEAPDRFAASAYPVVSRLRP